MLCSNSFFIILKIKSIQKRYCVPLKYPNPLFSYGKVIIIINNRIIDRGILFPGHQKQNFQKD